MPLRKRLADLYELTTYLDEKSKKATSQQCDNKSYNSANNGILYRALWIV